MPTQAEINVKDSLAEKAACEHFLGKSISEAETLLQGDSFLYQEDLLWMGPKAFCYYVQAAVRYVMGPASQDDAEFTTCLATILQTRLHQRSPEFGAIAATLAGLCDYILNNPAKFNFVTGAWQPLQTHFTALKQGWEKYPY